MPGMTALNVSFSSILTEIYEPVTCKEASFNFGSDFLTALYCKVIKGREDNFILKSELFDKVIGSLLDGRIIVNACFKLDVCNNICILNKLKIFS